MFRRIRLIVAVVFIVAIASTICVAATDGTKAGGAAQPNDFQGYDIGKYGISSPEYYGWDADVLYSVARYKRTNVRYAGNDAESITGYNGGWISWHVYCVSDGEEATEYSVFYSDTNKDTTADYYDTYGTRGYTNKLHIKGCRGSFSAALEISRGVWCPDGNAPLTSYLNTL